MAEYHKLYVILLASAGALTGAPALVVAQDSAYEEIRVTARKREESLQDVPLSISAFTEEGIRRQNIQDLQDVALRTPGLNYEPYVSGGVAGAPVIRGLTQTQLTNRVQNVATFLDGMYLQNQAMIDVGILDIARVEVVKGPQSALYGQNAFAGAINYVTTTPTDEIDAQLDVAYGSDEREDVTVSLSGPIIEGRLRGKIAWGSTEFDGTWDNNHPLANVTVKPGTVDKLGGWDNDAFSAGLYFNPVENIELRATYYRADVNREIAPSYSYSGVNAVGFGLTPFNDLNCNVKNPNVNLVGAGPGNSLYCGELPVQPAVPAGDPRPPGLVVDPRSFGQQSETDLITLGATWDFDDLVRVSYTYGTVDFEAFSAGINDRDPVTGANIAAFIGLPFPVLQNSVDARPNSELESYSHELRIQSIDNSRLQWQGGFYLYKVEDSVVAASLFVDPLGLDSLAPASQAATAGLAEFEDEAVAVFGAVDYQFTDAFSAGLEARYTIEDKSINPIFGSQGGPATQPPNSEDFEYFTPRLTLNYRLDDERLLFASAAKGVKAGGFNNAVNPDQASYDEEENWTYELGLRSTWFDQRLRFNVTGFFVDWSDLQISAAQFGPGVGPLDPTVIDNVGGAESIGVEVDVAWSITDSLTASLGYAWQDATYDDGVFDEALDRNIFTNCVNCITDANIGGNTLERQSENQATFNLDYNQPIGQLSLIGNLNVNYLSEQYLSALNVGSTGDRTLANARVGVAGDWWDVALWCRNCFDEEYVANSFFVSFANAYAVSLGQQRMWGLDVRLRYGGNL